MKELSQYDEREFFLHKSPALWLSRIFFEMVLRQLLVSLRSPVSWKDLFMYLKVLTDAL